MPRRLLTSFTLLTYALALIAGCSPGGGGDQGGLEVTRFDGLPDKSATSNLANFALKTRWQKQDLKYFITSFTSDVSQETQRQIIAQALDVWRAQIPLEFTEVFSAGEADMVFGFGEGDHCELYQAASVTCPTGAGFDGEGGILAHCYFPPGSGGAAAGDCHFDDSESWTDDDTSTIEVRLLETAIHEFGHGLGLAHSDDPNATMFPSYDPNHAKLALGTDDIAGVQELYGAREGKVEPRSPTAPEAPNPDDVPTTDDAATPTPTDTDGDGLEDGIELFLVGTDPENPDTDGDGLSDFEVVFGLNPLNPDTDGDGVNDGEELLNGTDPLTPDFGGTGVEAFAGTYFGEDSEGSDLEFKVETDGSASGSLSIQQYGFLYDLELFGGADADGNLLLISFDYIFVLSGTLFNGHGEGSMEVFGPGGYGMVATWVADISGESPGVPECDDTCEFAFDGECDDGRAGAVTGLCFSGTDCDDCGMIDFGGGGGPDDSCEFAFDGECDDGRPGAVTDFCAPGTDSSDCEGVDGGGGFGCDDTCTFALDGECDDADLGGTGACPTGTDCFDCGGFDDNGDGFKRAAHKRSAAEHSAAKRNPSVKRHAYKAQAATSASGGKVKGRAKSDLYFPVPSQRVPLTSPVHYRVDWRAAKQRVGAESH